jgi:Cullin family
MSEKCQALTVHVVAASVWPAHLLSATTYSSLILPPEILELRKHYESFFQISSQPSTPSEDITGNDMVNCSTFSSRSILVEGAVGQYSGINGEYGEMVEYMDDCETTFIRKVDCKWMIVYSAEHEAWQIKLRAFNESSSHVAYCKSDASAVKNKVLARATGVQYSTPLPIGMPWTVFHGVTNTWVESSIRVSFLSPFGDAGPISTKFLLHANLKVPQIPLRRLTWCHTASTVTLSVRLNNHLKAYIHSSVPQAILLLAYRGACADSLTVKEICTATGLSLKEVQKLLISASNKSAPILVHQPASVALLTYRSGIPTIYSTPPRHRSLPQHTTRRVSEGYYSLPTSSPRGTFVSHIDDIGMDDVFVLNPELLKGSLGGLSEHAPIVLAVEGLSVRSSSDSLLAATGGSRSARSWRNELIDACIVRTLKIACRTTINGNSSSSSSCPPPATVTGESSHSKAVPADLLYSQTKEILSDRNGLVATAEDIIRRAERLVSAGIIKKINSRSETFRSVAYCYFSDNEDENPSPPLKVSTATSRVMQSDLGSIRKTALRISVNPLESPQDVISAEDGGKVVGEDLYHRLRDVLNIKRLPDNAPGISQQLFIFKFIEWISTTKCCVMGHNAVMQSDDSSSRSPCRDTDPLTSSLAFSTTSSSIPSIPPFSAPIPLSLSAFTDFLVADDDQSKSSVASLFLSQPNKNSRPLVKIAKLLRHLGRLAMQQLEALSSQHSEGLAPLLSHLPSMNIKSDTKACNLFFRERKALSQEQSNEEEKHDTGMIRDLNGTNSNQVEKSFYDDLKNCESNLTVSIPDNDNDIQCLILNMCRVSVRYLPVGVVRLLLNAFRTAAGYAAKDYEASDEEFYTQRVHQHQTTHREGNALDSTADDLLFSKIIREEVLLEIQAIRNDASWPSGFPTLKREVLPHEMWHLLDLLESPLGKTAGLPVTVVLPGPPAFSWPFTTPEKTKVMEAFYADAAVQGQGRVSEKSPLLCPIDRDRVILSGSKGDLGSMVNNNFKTAGSFDLREEKSFYAESVGSEKSFYSCVGDHDVPMTCSASEDGIAALVFDRFIVAAFSAASGVADDNTDACGGQGLEIRDSDRDRGRDTTHKARKSISQRLCGEGLKRKNVTRECALNKIITTQIPQYITSHNTDTPERKGTNQNDENIDSDELETKCLGELIVDDFLCGVSRGAFKLFLGQSRACYEDDDCRDDNEDIEERNESIQEKDNTKSQDVYSGIHTQEPMLPCEFCSELIRFAVLEQHQLECGALRGEISRGQGSRGWTTAQPRRIQLQIREEDINDEDDDEGPCMCFLSL